MPDIALYTIGNFTIDDIVLWPTGQNWMSQPGGNVLFSALGARVWLETVGLLARIGRDYPRERLREIEARGLYLGLRSVDLPTIHSWALYEAEGERQFVNHLHSGSNVTMTIHPEEIEAEHLTGRAYHLAPAPVEQQAALIKRLKPFGSLISLDPHELWINGYEAIIEAMLAEVDFFLPSRFEARLLYGTDAPEEAARAFARWGSKVVVIKLGADGSLVYDSLGERLVHVPAYPAQVHDTTGAGDAFCGGFLAGYLLTGDPVIAAQYGTVSASYVVEAIGALATPRPTPTETQTRLTYLKDQMNT